MNCLTSVTPDVPKAQTCLALNGTEITDQVLLGGMLTHRAAVSPSLRSVSVVHCRKRVSAAAGHE